MDDRWKKLKFFKHVYPNIETYLRNRERQGATILPDKSLRFRALETLAPDNVRVVILGQDPYPTPGMAHGLAFSVPANTKRLPPSLNNVFTEYCDDTGFPRPRNGNLSVWAEKGVLLLNTILTVEANKPNSHAHIGWENLTYEVIRMLSNEREGLVFLLWGKQAEAFQGGIDHSKHFVFTSAHPSPLARNAPNPFLGSKPFTKTCEALGESKEFWRLP